jgi:pimeloyl-ACP methyl ester carboxylesterase
MTTDQAALEASMRELTISDGTTRRVLDRGEGEVVVFMPMITELNFVYAPQIVDLQRDHRVVLYEPKLSAERRVGLEDRADEARAVLASLGVPRAHFVVWGDTGSAAYVLARDHPEIVRSLVLIGLADRYRFSQPYGALLGALRRLPLERVVSARTFAKALSHYVGGSQVLPEWIQQKGERVPELAAVFKRSIQPNLTDHRPRAGEVAQPCLLIAGDSDRIVSPDQARRMAALLPRARPVLIRAGGEHFVNYTDDEWASRVIREFLASLPPV